MFKPARLERRDSFGDPIGVRLYPHQREALEAWIAARGDPTMTTVRAMRTLVSETLGVSPDIERRTP